MTQLKISETDNFSQNSLEEIKLTQDSRLSVGELNQDNLIKAAGVMEAVICFSHLRWDFVYQRPQHLMSRFASLCRVFFIEEPVYTTDEHEYLEISKRGDQIWIIVPHLPDSKSDAVTLQKYLIDNLLLEYRINNYLLWYYTPMALAFTDHLHPLVTIYDCMDELSAFKDAPPALKEKELQLFKKSDLVFTGGQSLYEVKRHQHPNVYAFPSSIDVKHFAQAQAIEPTDQIDIPHPRLGFYGVIDERMDTELLDGIATTKPDWHLIIIGPVVKIDSATLPRHRNIHYLGSKSYQQLPDYLAGWDVALLPFARNESTRFISPTKTPEYLAASKPVVSTSIRDVVSPYGELGLVQIADTVTEFTQAIAVALQVKNDPDWLNRVNVFLAQNSWDQTWTKMNQLIEAALAKI